jgi:predicted Holliday junction resolvase-like endonuclease
MRLPFVASRSLSKMTMADYYSQMMMNHLERQELEDLEREGHRIEQEEWLLQLELEKRERDLRLEEVKKRGRE